MSQAPPRIGITTSRYPTSQGLPAIGTPQTYIHAVLQAGGLPLLLPFTVDEATAARFLETIDGLVLTGGGDIAAEFTHEDGGPLRDVIPQRDRTEFTLVRLAIAHGIPFLAICRGVQVLNVALGGRLYVHLPEQLPDLVHDAPRDQRDRPVHTVRLEPHSRLAQLLGTTALAVNSLHHQGLREVAPGLRAVGWAEDGLVEAVEVQDHPFGLGVQWHPELLLEHDPRMARLFEALVAQARARRQAQP